MKNNRGQALVEFVLVLPVLLLLIFALIDFGRIIVCKSHLEGVMNEVTNLEDSEISNYLKTDDEKTDKVMNLIEALEEIDDVQNVYHNMEV